MKNIKGEKSHPTAEGYRFARESHLVVTVLYLSLHSALQASCQNAQVFSHHRGFVRAAGDYTLTELVAVPSQAEIEDGGEWSLIE